MSLRVARLGYLGIKEERQKERKKERKKETRERGREKEREGEKESGGRGRDFPFPKKSPNKD